MLQATAYKIDIEDTSKLCLKSTKIFQKILLKSSSYRFYKKEKKKSRMLKEVTNLLKHYNFLSLPYYLLTIM